MIIFQEAFQIGFSYKRTKKYFLFEKDVTNPGKYELSDYVIHAASIASPLYYRKKPN